MSKSASKKLNIGVIPLTLILAVITLGFIMLVRSQTEPSTVNRISTPAQNVAPPVRNADDLDAVAAELDSTDPATLDAELGTLNSETSAF